MLASDELRGFLARLLGWDNPRAVELAIRSLELATEYRAEFVLCGAGDMVPIARALHRRILGDDRTFAVADPRRGAATPRSRGPRCGWSRSGLRATTARRRRDSTWRPHSITRKGWPALSRSMLSTEITCEPDACACTHVWSASVNPVSAAPSSAMASSAYSSMILERCSSGSHPKPGSAGLFYLCALGATTALNRPRAERPYQAMSPVVVHIAPMSRPRRKLGARPVEAAAFADHSRLAPCHHSRLAPCPA
jgi:hypothetical protein